MRGGHSGAGQAQQYEAQQEARVEEEGGGGWCPPGFFFSFLFNSADVRPYGTLIEEIIKTK